MAILAATLADPAHAQGSPVYLVTYVSVMPNAVVSGATLLERYRDASRKEAGNQRLDVLHEITRPNRFAILEVWKDEPGSWAMTKPRAPCTSGTNSRGFRLRPAMSASAAAFMAAR
jgi:hypothetical protein